jgi:hypothetical protein
LSVFEDAEEEDTPTIKQLQGMLADQAVKNKMSVDDFIKNTDDGASLAARIAGRRLQGGDEEDKARTASQIRTLVNSRLQEEIAPLQFKSITYDPNLQDFVVTIPGSPEAIQFLEKRRNVAADVFKNAGLLKGNKLSDRNAADAISPFAVVDYKTLTIKSWRPVAGSTGGAGHLLLESNRLHLHLHLHPLLNLLTFLLMLNPFHEMLMEMLTSLN